MNKPPSLDKAKEAQVFAVEYQPERWAFIRITKNKTWGIWDVCSTAPQMPIVGPRPEKWFFQGIVPKEDKTKIGYLGDMPFASEEDRWPLPSHEPFSEDDTHTLIWDRGSSRYGTREEVKKKGISQVMRGTLKNLADRLRDFDSQGQLRLVKPAAGPPMQVPISSEYPKPNPKRRKSPASSKVAFDSDGNDRTTFAPFVLQDCGDEVRLMFYDWEWLHKKYGGDSIGDYYLNGPGVEGLVLATREMNGLDPDPDTMDPNSEGDACYIHFTDFDEAVRTASLCAKMIHDSKLLKRAAKVAEEKGYGD